MKRIKVTIVLLMLSIYYGLSQNIITKPMPFFYNLISNEIWDIFQDHEGYLWIGTTNGLARYDGYNLQNFHNDYKNPNLLTDNSISDFAENGRYVFIATRKGLNSFDKKTFHIVQAEDKRLRSANIESIVSARNKQLWVASEGQIFRCDSTGHILKTYHLEKILRKSSITINSIYEDKFGNLWGLLGRNGLCKYDAIHDTFLYIQDMVDIDYFIMYQDNRGKYWIGTWGNGLWEYVPDAVGKNKFIAQSVLNKKTGKNEPCIYSIVQDDAYGYLWILSYNELYALQRNTQGLLESVDLKNKVDTHKMYTRITKDREGNLWLGSYDEAKQICFDRSTIENYPISQIKKDFGWDVNLLTLCVDENQVIWMSQDRLGLCFYDLKNGKVSYSNLKGKVIEVNWTVKSNSPGMMWINDRSTPHIMRVSYRAGKVSVVDEIYLNETVKNCGTILQMQEDRLGNLWVLTSTHLLVLPYNNRHKIISRNRSELGVFPITLDQNGRVWGFSNLNQVQKLELKDGIRIENFSAKLNLRRDEHVQFSCIDSRGCIWVVSSLGNVYQSDSQKGKFQWIEFTGWLDDCTILNMLADQGYLWVVTNKKLIKYDMAQHSFNEYTTTDDNIDVHLFRHQAVSLDGNGGIYAGGHNGFVHIVANEKKWLNTTEVVPVITDIKVNNHSIYFDKVSDQNNIEKIYLQPEDRNIEIFFSSLEYGLEGSIQIAYKLEGMDKEWINLTPEKHTAFYNKLSKGSYILRLKYLNKLNQWIECKYTLTIVQQPAIYETWYAYLFYLLVIVGLCLSIHRFYLHRIKVKNEVKLKDELARIKLDYFTNVSHELLTPLSVITAMVELWERNNPEMKKQILMLKTNVQKLRRLIQQVLDFRKVDIGMMPLAVSHGRIDTLVHHLCCNSFTPLAEKKNINLEVKIQAEPIEGYLDFEKLDQILYNLLSNAIKYTPNNKRVEVNVSEENRMGHRFLILKIVDEGIGIQVKNLDQIFTRFYTNTQNVNIQSNGIGLSLTKELVELHHGSIQVQSEYGEGTIFTIELPIDGESYSQGEIIAENQLSLQDEEINLEQEVLPTCSTEKSQLLIIDDNPELLYILWQTFQEKYDVLKATNVKQAWETIVEKEVDVIICDVMLPDDSGWNLCRKIKTDLRFRHIPVIILTARQSVEDRITSYNVGADGFLAKPFESKLLLARIDNLIVSNKLYQTEFRKESEINLETLAYKAEDKEFLQTIVDEIEKHLKEAEFDLEVLARELNMSKSTLYRKVKSMTGLTPLDFIKNIKMKRACQMLLTRNLTVSEIAYALGFNNPKYFTKYFKEEIGLTPTEFQQKLGSSKV